MALRVVPVSQQYVSTVTSDFESDFITDVLRVGSIAIVPDESEATNRSFAASADACAADISWSRS